MVRISYSKAPRRARFLGKLAPWKISDREHAEILENVRRTIAEWEEEHGVISQKEVDRINAIWETRATRGGPEVEPAPFGLTRARQAALLERGERVLAEWERAHGEIPEEDVRRVMERWDS